jgi:hypothetical protein
MICVFFLLGLYLVDQPDIEILNHGTYAFQLRFGPRGEVLCFGNIGLWERFSLGVSYGASNLIGAGDPEFYDQPGIQARILALEGNNYVPALVFGFDNQGYGRYFSGDTSRYEIMSKGLYLQTGPIMEYPEFKIVPSIGFNYSFEDDGRFDVFSGVKFEFGASTQTIIDYSLNLKDDLDQNKGYLNAGLRIIFYQQLFFEFALRDLLDNSIEDQQLNRMIKIGYQETF